MNKLVNRLAIIVMSAGLTQNILAADYHGDALGPGDKDAKWIVGATAYSTGNP